MRVLFNLLCDSSRLSQESLEQYYQQFIPAELGGVKAVAMDMRELYIAATKAFVPDAASKIVFDKFHVMPSEPSRR